MTDFEQETQKIELERKRLELEKMRVEIADASMAFWKRPGYLAGLSPLLIALAGVFTAWVTGYFDTQRAELANDIAALEIEKSSLTEEIADAQKTIDHGYLRIRSAAEEAQYALGHFAGYSKEYTGAINRLIDLSDQMPDDGIAAVNVLTDLSADRFNIVQITNQSLADLNTTIAEIDASDWAKALTTDPFLTSQGLFRSEDGQFYDLSKERFLSEAEARDLGPQLLGVISSD